MNLPRPPSGFLDTGIDMRSVRRRVRKMLYDDEGLEIMIDTAIVDDSKKVIGGKDDGKH